MQPPEPAAVSRPGASHPLEQWLPVLPMRELGTKPVECHLFEREIVLYRGLGRRAHALDNRCPHRRMRLALGHVEGDRIVCPYHGWNFGPDGCGAAPATPDARPRTRCYDVQERHGMVWLRDSRGRGDMPALEYPGFRPLGQLHHRLNAPLALLLDNMTELEHTASVHTIFGFETAHLHAVRTEVRDTPEAIEIDYEGPQRKLPLHLRLATGLQRGDRFVQRAVVRHRPLQAVYDLEWFARDTLLQRPLALKFVIFFNEVGSAAGTQTTFVYGQATDRRNRIALRLFSSVLMHHIDCELRADIGLVEQLRLEPETVATGALGRFDRPLVLRRRAEAQAAALTAALTAAPTGVSSAATVWLQPVPR
jgi:phenylpropionate dioxygenase-like ring-hydroxylating dioxygenase large terminal subunit